MAKLKEQSTYHDAAVLGLIKKIYNLGGQISSLHMKIKQSQKKDEQTLRTLNRLLATAMVQKQRSQLQLDRKKRQLQKILMDSPSKISISA